MQDDFDKLKVESTCQDTGLFAIPTGGWPTCIESKMPLTLYIPRFFILLNHSEVQCAAADLPDVPTDGSAMYKDLGYTYGTKCLGKEASGNATIPSCE